VRLTTFLLMLFNVVLLVTGQILWKRAVTTGWLEAFGSSDFWIGLVFYGLSTVVWLKVLSVTPLSIAYPLQALAYVLGIAAAATVLHEHITFMRWLGTGLIVAGVAVIGLR
jgi:drug/metabolite transporter (DMT)-like permease